MSKAVASPKQFAFIRNLIEDRKVQLNIEHVNMAVEALQHQRLTGLGASAVIDKLLGMGKDSPAPLVENTPAINEIRTNGYAGKCASCGTKVEAKAGALTKEGGRWITRHFEGACPGDLQTKLNTMLVGRHDGYFAVPYIGESSATDLTFFGICTRKSNGDRYVVHVVGGHGDTEDVSLAWIERAITTLDAVDHTEALLTYGRELGACCLCGRTLTNEQTRAAGIGNDCAAKL
jgi:hypothetical protein